MHVQEHDCHVLHIDMLAAPNSMRISRIFCMSSSYPSVILASRCHSSSFYDLPLLCLTLPIKNCNLESASDFKSNVP